MIAAKSIPAAGRSRQSSAVRTAAPAVLVTDGDQRAALAVVRSLGMAGYHPFVCSTSGRSLAGASRFCGGEAAVLDPLRHPQDYVAELSRLVERWGIEVVVPISEPALLAVLDARERFEGVEIPFADAETFRRICDKAALLETAGTLGIATPAQRVVEAPAAIRSLDLRAVEFPVVIKPARSVGEGNGERVKVGVSYASDGEELLHRLAKLPSAAYPVLLQQRIIGPGLGVFLLQWEGHTRAVFAHRRIREKPPSGGVSVYRESVAADPMLVQRSRALLEAFDWRGVAMVEYKIDQASGTPYLMEINGRFWGSLQLAVDAGVDFPALLVDAALGRETQPARPYLVGTRSRWWWGDVDQLITMLRRSPEELALPPDAPPRWRSILDFLILWRPGDRNEILRWTDPAPLIRESIDWFARR
jgi:predicted ATP-grasp superfamily ATP-dependent carboligase